MLKEAWCYRFYAKPKELELVSRIYKRKGFEEVVIQESIVKDISTPRGWYRTYLKFAKGDGPSDQLRQTLGREYDVRALPNCCFDVSCLWHYPRGENPDMMAFTRWFTVCQEDFSTWAWFSLCGTSFRCAIATL